MSRAATAAARSPETPGTALLTRAPELPDAARATALCPARLYLGNLTTPASKRTMESRLRCAARLLGSTLEQMPWGQITRAWLIAVKDLLTKQKAHPGTINLTLQAMKGVALNACDEGQISADDLHRIQRVPLVAHDHVPRGRSLAEDELARLLAAGESEENDATRLRDLALFALLAGAGLRRSEAAGLDVGHYDGRRLTLLVNGKGHRQRVIHLADEGCRRALDDWLSLRGRAAGPLLCPVDRWGRLGVGRPLSTDAIYKAVRTRAAEAGVPRCSPHDLRHTFASRLFNHLLSAGADTADVQKLLGHAKEKDTRTYDHRGEESKKRVMRHAPLPFGPRRRRKPRSGKPRRRKTSPGPIKFTKKFMREVAVNWAASGEEGQARAAD